VEVIGGEVLKIGREVLGSCSVRLNYSLCWKKQPRQGYGKILDPLLLMERKRNCKRRSPGEKICGVDKYTEVTVVLGF
jgi:hypothetical protein